MAIKINGLTLRPTLSKRARLSVDPLTQNEILLYPEGILLLNETAALIIKNCDGKLTLKEIREDLVRKYRSVEFENIDAFLDQLGRRNLLHYSE